MIKGLVIAGNYRQYINWLMKNKLDKNEFKYCNKKEDLYGYHNIKVYHIGTFQDNVLFGSRELINYLTVNLTRGEQL